MDIFSGLVLGLVQGLTEFIPVSSSGHLIIARDVFGFDKNHGLAVDAILQLGTAFAVPIYFWKDLLKLLKSLISITLRREVEERTKILLYAVVVGTIPAVFVGLILEDFMETVFRSSLLVSGTLILGGILFLVAEKLGKQNRELTVKRGLFIGLFQIFALIPGMSRSGMTISGGLLLGLNRVEATRFSFILSFPIIFGSGLKKFIELEQGNIINTLGYPLLVAFLVSFAVGLASIHFLMIFLKDHSLKIFAYYRFLLASLVLIFIIYFS